MTSYLDCWVHTATELLSQGLAAEAQLSEHRAKPQDGGSFSFAAVLSGEEEGRFVVMVEESILEAPLLGEGVDQRAAWQELLRETFDAAAGELLARTGRKCRVEKIEAELHVACDRITRAFQLETGGRSWMVLVRDELETVKPAAVEESCLPSTVSPVSVQAPALSPGLELLLDVELEAALRFGCREMALGEILDLGPGDVVQLDRHASDPVDLIVGDKIVALVNGNFGLRVTEVSSPKLRLESIRCLF
jgi:flagellar motor switch protein FliN/FliY